MRNLLHIKKHRGHSASVLFTLKNCFYDKPNNNQPKNNNWHGITPLLGLTVLPNVLRIGSAPLPNRAWNTFYRQRRKQFCISRRLLFFMARNTAGTSFSSFLIFLSLCRRLFGYYIWYLQACTSPYLFRRGANVFTIQFPWAFLPYWFCLSWAL